jgi:mevalonate kinase
VKNTKKKSEKKAAKAAKYLKLKQKRELDKQGKPSIIDSIILYYFSIMSF